MKWYNLPGRFPYGKAPFWILMMGLAAGAYLGIFRYESEKESYDLEFALFAPEHLEAYRQVIGEFEQQHGVKVKIELVNQKALQGRLQSALLAGAKVPDMVEIINMGYFTKGPLQDVMFVDLTDRLRNEGLDTAMVASRFSLWSSRGRVFALPHDLHPVMLAYRRDIVEDQLGIDVDTIRTWWQFAEMGRRIKADTDGDGIVDRYALQLPDGYYGLLILMLQRGLQYFDSQGRPDFNKEELVDLMVWYIDALHGPDPFAYSNSQGQMTSKILTDGLILFYLTPDWMSKNLENDVPGLAGKMALMPLPAWEEGGARASTWGGTGLAITRQCKKPELAWQLAKFLYFEERVGSQIFEKTHILPARRDRWTMPILARESSFYSGQKIGLMYASIAPQVPAYNATAYTSLVENKINEVFARGVLQAKKLDSTKLREFIRADLNRCALQIERVMYRNAFLQGRSR